MLASYIKKLRVVFFRSVLILIGSLMILTSLPVVANAALSPEQKRALAGGSLYFDYEESCDQLAQTSQNITNVYIMGDSITVRSEAQYKSKFSERGVTTTVINASVGRSWGGGGIPTATAEGSLEPGREAVQTDSEKIKAAQGIVIALGTNGGLAANQIEQVIQAFRAQNSSAKIWWVNTAGTSGNVGGLGEFNRQLNNLSSANNYSVIDWFKIVNPEGDPYTSPTIDTANVLEDNVHPNADGIERLTDLVTNTVVSTSTIPAPTPPTTNSPTSNSRVSTNQLPPPGSPNPYHTVEYPSALGGFSDEAISGAINKYISERKPESVFAGLGGDFVAGAKAHRINPFLPVAHLEKENGFATAPDGWHKIPGSNNAFGRTATDSQPHVLSPSGRKVYKWASWQDSLSGNDSWFVYIRRKLDRNEFSKNLDQYINQYAPPSENDTQKYIRDVKNAINTMAGYAGDPNIASYASSSSQASGATNCSCSIASASGAATLPGNDNREKVWNYLVGTMQFTATQAAGIMANLQAESEFNPIAAYPGTTSELPHGKAWGLAQWLGGRQTNLINFARERNQPVNSLELQLEFLRKELEEDVRPGVLADIRASTTIEEATYIFLERFESPCQGQSQCAPFLEKRLEFANAILSELGGITPGSVSSGGCNSGVSLPGVTCPANLEAHPTRAGYYRLPEAPNGEYIIYSRPEARFGSQQLVCVLHSVALAFNNAMQGRSKLRIGDLNATNHKSHNVGRAVDLSGQGELQVASHVASWKGRYDKDATVLLGRLFADTGALKNIWWCPPAGDDSIEQMLTYAQTKGLQGQIKCIEGHADHFHVDLKDEYKLEFWEP